MTEHSALHIVEEFLGAANRHDIAAALDLLADDFVFRDDESGDGTDKAWMEELFGWDKEIDAQASYNKLTVDEDGTVFGEFAETNLLYAELGMKETRCALRFRVEAGKIVEQAIEQAIGDGPTFEDSLEPFLIWADENAPEELDDIQPEGQISFTAEMARKWLALIRKWKAAQ